jgi:O-antigen ligase
MWLIAWFELVLTFSRAAALAAAIGCVVWLLTKLEFERSARTRSLLVAVAAFAAFVAAGLLGREIVTGAAPGGADPAVADRVALARIAITLVKAHPVLGVGAGNFSVVESLPPIDGVFVDPVHVVPLLVAAEAGILAGVAWLGLILAPMVDAWRLRYTEGADSPLRLAVAGVILTIGSFDHYLWTIASGRVTFWVALAFLYASRPRLGVVT